MDAGSRGSRKKDVRHAHFCVVEGTVVFGAEMGPHPEGEKKLSFGGSIKVLR